MPLRFNERGPATAGAILPIVLLAASLLIFSIYALEGATGPLHTVQGAVSVVGSPLRTLGTGLQSAATGAQTSLEDANATPETLSALREENERLRQQVSELEEYRQTAIRLEGIQKLRDTYSIEGVTCHVIALSGTAWNRVVTIDKGSDDGISVGLAVTGATGLIGQVKSVTPTTAEVRLIQDPESGVAVIVQSSRVEGLLKGDIDGLLYLEGVGSDVAINVGDVLITSGAGGGYSRGLIVGTVVRVNEGNGQSIRRIVVAPNETITALEEVLVVTSIGSDGALDASLSLEDDPEQGSSKSADDDEDRGEGEPVEGDDFEDGYSDDDYADDYFGDDEE